MYLWRLAQLWFNHGCLWFGLRGGFGLRGFRRNCSATVKLAGGAGVFEYVWLLESYCGVGCLKQLNADDCRRLYVMLCYSSLGLMIFGKSVCAASRGFQFSTPVDCSLRLFKLFFIQKVMLYYSLLINQYISLTD